MIPATYPITIFQGDDFDLIFRIKNDAGEYLDLTGFFPAAQIRASVDSPDVLAQFSATLSNQTVSPGGVILALTPAQTDELPASGGVWDVQLENSIRTEIRTYLSGRVTVIEQVTR